MKRWDFLNGTTFLEVQWSHFNNMKKVLFVGRKGFLIPEKIPYLLPKDLNRPCFLMGWDGIRWAMGFFLHFFKRQMIRFPVIWRQFILFFFIVPKNLTWKHQKRPDFGFSLPLSLFHFHDAFRTIYETSYTCLNHIFPPREGILPNPCTIWKTQLEGDIAHKKYQIKFFEMRDCRIQREGWGCYYLCQCLDWTLFSINYLEDLHKLLPS